MMACLTFTVHQVLNQPSKKLPTPQSDHFDDEGIRRGLENDKKKCIPSAVGLENDNDTFFLKETMTHIEEESFLHHQLCT